MLGVDTRTDVDGGAIFETTHERSPARLFVVHRSRWPLATRSGRGRPPSEGFPDDGTRGSEESTMPGVDARVEQRQHRKVCALGDGSKAPGKRPPDHASGSSPLRGGMRHLPAGCSSGSTASSDAALAGWHDRPAVFGRQGPGVHPDRRPPRGKVGEGGRDRVHAGSEGQEGSIQSSTLWKR